jgi:HEAT repeat protein
MNAKRQATLITALGDESPRMRWDAVYALSKIRAPAVEPLVAALGDEKNHIAALKDKDEDVREAAAEALGEIAQFLLPDHPNAAKVLRALEEHQ